MVVAAFRAALWIFLFAAASGFGMGGRGRHTAGGDDGGPGRAITNWSTTSRDLRVSHFFALHSLEILPLLAVLLARMPQAAEAQWTLLVIGVAADVLLVLWTFGQALAARSFL